MTKVIILRGVSGCGKSFVADTLKDLSPEKAVVCCADDYFMKDGEYKFDVRSLGRAHQACFAKFGRAVDDQAELVIVANTNTSEREFKEYKRYAEDRGIPVISLVVENRHGGTDTHGVPEDVKQKQEERLIKSLMFR